MFLTRLPPSLRALVLIGLALALLLPGLGRRDITTSHEARVALSARTMAESGSPWDARLVTVPAMRLVEVGKMKLLRPADDLPPVQVNPWLVPVMSGQIRLQKPPLPYWLDAICFQVFGFSEAAARLPSALMTALAAALVFDIGRRLLGKRAGWYAGLAWISLYFVYDEHRKALADPDLSLFSLLAIWAWVRASQRTKDEGGRMKNQSSSLILLFYIALALGNLAKGPLVFLHVGLALGAIHWCGRLRLPGRWWLHSLGAALLLAIALPWPIYILQHIPNAIELWRYESIGEFGDNEEKARSVFYYLPQIPYLSLPWTGVWLLQGVMAIVGWRHAASPRRLRRARRELFPLLWLGVALVTFSAMNVKKNAYLLPEMAAVALTVGSGLRRLVLGMRIPALRPLSRIFVIAMIVVGAVAALITWPLHKAALMPANWMPQDAMAWLGLIAVSISAALIFGLVPLMSLLKRRNLGHWPAAQAAVLGVAIMLVYNLDFVPTDNRRSAKPACQEALALLKEGGRTLAASPLAEEVAVYLPLDPMDAVAPENRFASKVLYIRDDAAGVDARRHGHSAPAFDPKGMHIAGGDVTEAHRLPIPTNRGDVRWQLWELTISRTAVAEVR